MSEIKEKIENRQKYNLEIIKELETYFIKNKDVRFIQGLWALGIININKEFIIEDKFYEESIDTLDKIKSKQGDVNDGKRSFIKKVKKFIEKSMR